MCVEAKKVTSDRKNEYSKMIADCRAELKSVEVKKKKTVIHKVSYIYSVSCKSRVCICIVREWGEKSARESTWSIELS